MATWRATDPQLFFSRQDPDDQRLGDLVHSGQPTVGPRRAFAVAGYPDDDGIELNGGRVGAALAPSAIRRFLYKMTPALQEPTDFELFDVGDLVPEGSLEERHAAGAKACAAALSQGARWIGLGGGHDYGFAEADGFLTWAKSSLGTGAGTGAKPLVINFDAHFDVRPPTNGMSSGTPFYRMLTSGHELDFAELGIQSQCNSKKHLEWLTERGGRVLTMEDVEASGESFATNSVRLLGDWILRPRPCFISVDIDAFSSAVAPGCSQSWANGFLPHDFFPLFDLLIKRMDVRVLGIYETSPPLDQDDRTSKLAALIAHRFISRGGRT